VNVSKRVDEPGEPVEGRSYSKRRTLPAGRDCIASRYPCARQTRSVSPIEGIMNRQQPGSCNPAQTKRFSCKAGIAVQAKPFQGLEPLYSPRVCTRASSTPPVQQHRSYNLGYHFAKSTLDQFAPAPRFQALTPKVDVLDTSLTAVSAWV